MNAERYVALMVTSWSQNSNSHPDSAPNPYWTKVQYTRAIGSVYFRAFQMQVKRKGKIGREKSIEAYQARFQ